MLDAIHIRMSFIIRKTKNILTKNNEKSKMKNLLNQETIKDFLTTYSPPGNEHEIQSKFENILEELKADVILKDSSGNVTCLFGNYSNDNSKPTIMLAAHADEIA